MATSHFPIGAHLDDLLDPSGAPPHIPFADYMDACMFHPEVGYYGGGRVDFGLGRDYWTFAGRLAPFFGWMLAHRALDVFRAVGGAPFHVVELGGGEGQLLRDIAAGLARLAEDDADARRLLEVLRLVSIDRSAALLETQAATQQELPVEYLRRRAEDFADALPRPFHGLVVANELLDQMSAEVLRVDRDVVERLDVLSWIDGAPLAPGVFP